MPPFVSGVPLSLASPPSWPHWPAGFRSDNLDEVRALIGTTDGRQSRVARRGVPFGYSQFRLQGLRTNLGGSDSAVEQTVRGLVYGPVLVVALPEGSVFRTGRKSSAPTVPSSVVFAPAGWEFSRISPPGRMFAIELQPHALLSELEARRPTDGTRWAERPAITALGARDHAAIMLAASTLVQATEPGVDVRQLKLAEARVLQLMAELATYGAVEARPGELALQRARDLEGWIDAHLGEALTLGQLCRVAGVGARCLQRAFEYRRGMSPMRFVMERRVAAAYRRLAAAAPDVSVSRIALDLGFDHLSRFAQIYRQVIGESPSQTLSAR